VAIDVGCCDQITDASFLDHEGNEFQAKLRILKISSCARLTVSRVSNVVESFKDLEYLGLRSCPQITKDSCEQAGLQFSSGCKVNFDVSLFESDPSIEFF
jgi:F-box and leucine-rich repeat protein 2/20